MPSISQNNLIQLVNQYDSNKDGIMQELQIKGAAKQSIDTNKDGSISKNELVSGLAQDKVKIQNGDVLQSGIKQNLHIWGKETLENVNTSITRTLKSPHVWAPRAADSFGLVLDILVEDTRSYSEQQADRRRGLESSNLSYMAAVGSMRSTLRSVADMTQDGSDSQTKAVHQMAKQGLNSSLRWGTGIAVTGLLLGASGLESMNDGLQTSYSSLKGTLSQIKIKTSNLPQPIQHLNQLDRTLNESYQHLNQLEKQTTQNQSTFAALNKQAEDMDAQVTGRLKPYALIGAGVGAVVGATAGYFMGDKSMKSVAIGAGIGTAGAAAIGAFTGSQIDRSYEKSAESLRAQVQTLTSFQPQKVKSSLNQANQALYQHANQAQGSQNLDSAQALDTQIQGSQAKVNSLAGQLDQVQAAYQQATKK